MATLMISTTPEVYVKKMRLGFLPLECLHTVLNRANEA
jgi:hypothetical protein